MTPCHSFILVRVVGDTTVNVPCQKRTRTMTQLRLLGSIQTNPVKKDLNEPADNRITRFGAGCCYFVLTLTRARMIFIFQSTLALSVKALPLSSIMKESPMKTAEGWMSRGVRLFQS